MLLIKSFSCCLLGLLLLGATAHVNAGYSVKPLSEAQAKEYKLDRAFYKKATMVQDILIATSGRVANLAHQETAYHQHLFCISFLKVCRFECLNLL